MLVRLLKLAYQFRVHRLGTWTLDRELSMLALGAAGLILIRWLVRGKPVLPAWHWLVLAVLIVGGAGILLLGQWALRKQYVVFEPQEAAAPPAGRALEPEDKVLVHATGRFEVEGKSCVFADLLAYWRTFSTREHAVMAIAHASRFLLVSNRPDAEVGMWYIFFKPADIEAITPGRLCFGSAGRPALRVTYLCLPAAPIGRRRLTEPIAETVYLSFDDEPARLSVWADLLADR